MTVKRFKLFTWEKLSRAAGYRANKYSVKGVNERECQCKYNVWMRETEMDS